ncbi:MAG: hypothetical protein LBD64_01455 [Odoribacteraceae bacterium]|jgi:hypothetical protein|nr:hypothetical protein [Odoribacteraceae bacterium]
MWYRLILISEWFGEMNERYKLIRDFNRESKLAFISGSVPTLLEAKITKGDSAFRHEFSKFLGGGLRIKALTGTELSRQEMEEIGAIVLANEGMVRKLIVLGWDTLEIHDSIGAFGLKWKLKNYAHTGGLLNARK